MSSGTQHIGVGPRYRVAGAVHRAAARYLQGLAPAQEIGVWRLNLLSLVPPEREKEIPGLSPNIVGNDLDIDFAVGVMHRHDARVVHIGQEAQHPFGLRELAREISIAAGEQQLRLDGRVLGTDVQRSASLNKPLLSRESLSSKMLRVAISTLPMTAPAASNAASLGTSAGRGSSMRVCSLSVSLAANAGRSPR